MVLRNIATHGSTRVIDRDKALDYLTLADSVIFALETSRVVPRPSPEG